MALCLDRLRDAIEHVIRARQALRDRLDHPAHDGVEDQARNCLKTIAAALDEAGFALADVVRAHYYITDQAYVERVFPILGEVFGEVRPAATMIVCQLNKPEMKIEIEVTALRRQAASG